MAGLDPAIHDEAQRMPDFGMDHRIRLRLTAPRGSRPRVAGRRRPVMTMEGLSRARPLTRRYARAGPHGMTGQGLKSAADKILDSRSDIGLYSACSGPPKGHRVARCGPEAVAAGCLYAQACCGG
jgi:hypothetical protein